ncbi:hypothetical protein CIK05_11195 [Bdellovibrio sp. qaytius]|nr:hypothetical protein CIK05_11195 [Bdellovibrio sp. qaytius]
MCRGFSDFARMTRGMAFATLKIKFLKRQKGIQMQNQDIGHIIVGIDFSKYSKIVVKEAQKLSETMNVPITYCYAYEYFQTLGGTVDEFVLKMKFQIRKVYKLSENPKIIVQMGDPAEQLIEIAKKIEQAPLIIVGHKGYSKLARFFLGSTAEKVATLSPFPVWIHRGRRALLPKRILIPSDLTEQTDRALSQVKSFESSVHPSLELYHVIPNPIPMLDFTVHKEMVKQINDEDNKNFSNFSKTHPDLKMIRSHGNILDKVEKKSKGFDIVALSPRDKNRRNPLLGKVATKLIRSVNKPILICP